MEKRCQKFFDDSKKLKPQEVNSLKKFLYKNQDYKFMENDKSKLFGALEVLSSCSFIRQVWPTILNWQIMSSVYWKMLWRCLKMFFQTVIRIKCLNGMNKFRNKKMKKITPKRKIQKIFQNNPMTIIELRVDLFSVYNFIFTINNYY